MKNIDYAAGLKMLINRCLGDPVLIMMFKAKTKFCNPQKIIGTVLDSQLRLKYNDFAVLRNINIIMEVD